MKKLFVIILALFVGFAYAENENVPTSKKFVDTALAQKQPKFEALGNDKLMLYSDTTDGAVTSRDIVTTLGTSTSDTSVPTIGAINTGLNTKQDVLNGPSGWVAENTGVAGAVVQKPVYSTTNNYSNALVEVETLNNAVINAVNSELTVVPGVGWTINTANSLNLLPVPKTYNPYLPDGYTQLEYLESTGTQWINTGITITKTDNITMNMRAQFAPTNRYWMGANAYMQLLIQEAYAVREATGHPIEIVNVGNIDNITMEYSSQILSLRVNGQLVDSVDWHSLPETRESRLLLFALGNYTHSDVIHLEMGSSSTTNAKIYNCKVTRSDQLLRHFIPARRNSDGELGMYDTVSDTFFTNTGSGTFTAGPDVYF